MAFQCLGTVDQGCLLGHWQGWLREYGQPLTHPRPCTSSPLLLGRCGYVPAPLGDFLIGLSPLAFPSLGPFSVMPGRERTNKVPMWGLSVRGQGLGSSVKVPLEGT